MGLKEGYAALDLEGEWGVCEGVNLVQMIMMRSILDLVLLMCSWNIQIPKKAFGNLGLQFWS